MEIQRLFLLLVHLEVYIGSDRFLALRTEHTSQFSAGAFAQAISESSASVLGQNISIVSANDVLVSTAVDNAIYTGHLQAQVTAASGSIFISSQGNLAPVAITSQSNININSAAHDIKMVSADNLILQSATGYINSSAQFLSLSTSDTLLTSSVSIDYSGESLEFKSLLGHSIVSNRSILVTSTKTSMLANDSISLLSRFGSVRLQARVVNYGSHQAVSVQSGDQVFLQSVKGDNIVFLQTI